MAPATHILLLVGIPQVTAMHKLQAADTTLASLDPTLRQLAADRLNQNFVSFDGSTIGADDIERTAYITKIQKNIDASSPKLAPKHFQLFAEDNQAIRVAYKATKPVRPKPTAASASPSDSLPSSGPSGAPVTAPQPTSLDEVLALLNKQGNEIKRITAEGEETSAKITAELKDVKAELKDVKAKLKDVTAKLADTEAARLDDQRTSSSKIADLQSNIADLQEQNDKHKEALERNEKLVAEMQKMELKFKVQDDRLQAHDQMFDAADKRARNALSCRALLDFGREFVMEMYGVEQDWHLFARAFHNEADFIYQVLAKAEKDKKMTVDVNKLALSAIWSSSLRRDGIKAAHEIEKKRIEDAMTALSGNQMKSLESIYRLVYGEDPDIL
ncbi:hypothetical protein FA95DRAFT_1554004 [Auriscalpium vulgare]|uniref:Uncharacterized protein n=1 Tax=Auriscalpium vulgare TaxID=40419 RepID=A0ACB8S7W5_9AGAM|nr:hypothetical protein FA95DRAFT_1554004 [Auriscalpium vulgare]